MICTATLIGNLTKDPVTKTVRVGGEDKTVTEFSIAVNHGFGKDSKVSFFDCVAWNGLGTTLAQYRKQGDQVGVIAEPHQERWTSEGGNRSKVVFNAKTIEYLRSKGDGGSRSDEVPVEVLAASAPAAAVEAVVTAVNAIVQNEPAPTEAPAETQETLEVPF